MPAPQLSLPVCRHRGPEAKGRHPCASPRLVVCAAGVPASFCAACPVADKVGLASGNLPPEGYPTRRLTPCLYLGKVVDRLGCGCTGRWVHACEKRSRCTTVTPRDDAACCATCPDYAEDA